ncbi:DUF2264 domain-containing protein [Mucilaginibacter aquatilis]|uniref:DUF2264 domain-containing protein n=1 Tax=Mucilaginibacter aquatilis TaxID=1517760 RepID=A0A6I4IBI5_9SPHI|nr:DUF2264 domain-containing protein [Mucilaginibacter aquatilis]MVN90896.1 DUF2264 domain-containing protein [Mucilaginibacter aquatilis]
MKSKSILLTLIVLTLTGISVFAQRGKTSNRRMQWLNYLDKIARPVMTNIAADELKVNMPVELSEKVDNKENRAKVAYLEAFGRTLSGIAPWLQLEGGNAAEVKLRDQYRTWAIKGITNAVNPNARDYLEWSGGQPLVDASFVAIALIRCPWLWEHLESNVQNNVITALQLTRKTVPVYSNWILFTGAIEAFFMKYGLGHDPVRIEYGIREFTQHWYVGDGLFSDGMEFHLDYYNSIVIQPYLSDILDVAGMKSNKYTAERNKVMQIGKRYSQVLERLIGADGSYPVIGRSIAYRCGVFHHLANVSLKKQLPESLKLGQIREALTAVINKTIGATGTFNNKGWLNIGLHGKQPGLAEGYINTGSLYLCTNVFLPLGLPETDEFWSSPAAPWTAVNVWSGKNMPADHAFDLK